MAFFGNLWAGIKDAAGAITDVFTPSSDFWTGNNETVGSVGSSYRPPVKAPASTGTVGISDSANGSSSSKKWNDAYDYTFYMTLSKEKWQRSLTWLSRKLNTDYAAGRFTKLQYQAIEARVKQLLANDLPEKSVVGIFVDQAKDIASGVTKDAAGSAGSAVASTVGGSGMAQIIVVGLGALLIVKILR